MRWKIMREGITGVRYAWSLGYPTRKAAAATARRLNGQHTAATSFTVAKMTAEDEALASQLENLQ